MDDIFVYFVSLPNGIKEAVLPCADGYTVYIDRDLDLSHQIEAYNHAIRHIRNKDFDRHDVQIIECEAHRKE